MAGECWRRRRAALGMICTAMQYEVMRRGQCLTVSVCPGCALVAQDTSTQAIKGLARVSAAGITAPWSAQNSRRRQLLPGLSLELSFTDHGCFSPTPPPRRILVQRASPPPLPPVSGPAALCDALSCSLSAPLRPRPAVDARRPRRSTRHTPAQGLSAPPARTHTHCRSANQRPPATPAHQW